MLTEHSAKLSRHGHSSVVEDEVAYLEEVKAPLGHLSCSGALLSEPSVCSHLSQGLNLS
jgi:hypothetical protein